VNYANVHVDRVDRSGLITQLLTGSRDLRADASFVRACDDLTA